MYRIKYHSYNRHHVINCWLTYDIPVLNLYFGMHSLFELFYWPQAIDPWRHTSSSICWHFIHWITWMVFEPIKLCLLNRGYFLASSLASIYCPFSWGCRIVIFFFKQGVNPAYYGLEDTDAGTLSSYLSRWNGLKALYWTLFFNH